MPRFRRVFGVLALAALLATVAAPVADARKGGALTRIDRVENCNELSPESVQATARANVNLDVLVLLDAVPRPTAESIFKTTAGAYARMNITLLPTFKKATFDPSLTRAEALVEAARASLGGVRPTGSDVVYILTSRDIEIASGDVMGYADCIGGVRYPHRAFAIGEAVHAPENTGGLNFYLDAPAKVASHEIGHLMGGRHDYANCVEGAGAEDVGRREATACTVMTNYIDFQSNDFGTLESWVVRSYAEKYAAP